MNWSRIIRQTLAVVVASAIPVGVTTAFAGWSDGLGLGALLIAIGIGIVTIVHLHGGESLYSSAPISRSVTSQ